MAPLERLRISAVEAATPSRVKALASLAESVMAASGLDPNGEAFTLVVRNHSLVAELRPQTETATESITHIFGVARDPAQATTRYADGVEIAEALADLDVEAFPHGLVLGIGRKRVILDQGRIAALLAVAEEPSPRAVRGSTQIVSKVLRMGAVSAKKPETVRILVEGKPREVIITPSCNREPLVRALETKAWCELEIDAVWLRTADGLRLSHSRSRVTAATVKNFMNGRQFLDALRTAAPSLLALDPDAFVSDE